MENYRDSEKIPKEYLSVIIFKLTFKKHCEMSQIRMQKVVRNAVNLCAKNNCEMREIHMQKTVRNA